MVRRGGPQRRPPAHGATVRAYIRPRRDRPPSAKARQACGGAGIGGSPGGGLCCEPTSPGVSAVCTLQSCLVRRATTGERTSLGTPYVRRASRASHISGSCWWRRPAAGGRMGARVPGWPRLIRAVAGARSARASDRRDRQSRRRRAARHHASPSTSALLAGPWIGVGKIQQQKLILPLNLAWVARNPRLIGRTQNYSERH